MRPLGRLIPGKHKVSGHGKSECGICGGAVVSNARERQLAREDIEGELRQICDVDFGFETDSAVDFDE